MGTISLDLGAVRSAAQRIDAVVEEVRDVVDSRLGSWQFGGTTAGLAHAAAGAALRAELERLAIDLIRWAQAADEIAAVLRAGADGYAAGEADAVGALR